ncbi:MAG: hypothetical protein QOH47_2600 [Sphingomonadales bacterium]|nr:hypothetical protein [Sphingomonadales bacterium]
MGGTDGLPGMNEVAFFLSRYAPAVRDRFAERGPELSSLVEVGVVGGEAPALDAGSWPALEARAEVLSAALDEARTVADQALDRIRLRLKRLRRLRFITSLTATAGASSLIPAILTNAMAALAAGAFTLASNIAALSADKLVLGSNLNEDSLIRSATTLARIVRTSGLTQKLLEKLVDHQGESAALAELLRQANSEFADLSAALSEASALE